MSQASVPNGSGKEPGFSALRYTAAWAVHAYTALGFVAGFLALRATVDGRARSAFGWLAVAVLIDATDGMLARAARVKQTVPWFDGSKLDDLVDYFTFVIVPAVFVYQFQLMPASTSLLLTGLMLMASGYGFCQAEAKTADFFFTGFPSYWNIVVFYLYAAQTPAWLNAGVVGLCVVLVFVPIRYVYPSRTVPFRRLSNGLGMVWTALVVVLIWQLPRPHPWLLGGSLFYPVYYVAVSVYLHLTLPPEPKTAPTAHSPR